MKAELKMLSGLPLGSEFRTNAGENVYRLVSILEKGEKSMISGFVVINCSSNATGLKPFIIDSDRPIIVAGYHPVDI